VIPKLPEEPTPKSADEVIPGRDAEVTPVTTEEPTLGTVDEQAHGRGGEQTPLNLGEGSTPQNVENMSDPGHVNDDIDREAHLVTDGVEGAEEGTRERTRVLNYLLVTSRMTRMKECWRICFVSLDGLQTCIFLAPLRATGKPVIRSLGLSHTSERRTPERRAGSGTSAS